MRSVAIVGGLLLAACGGTRGSDDDEPAPVAAEGPPAEAPEGFVVLRASTRLYRRPSAEAPSELFDPGTDVFRSFEVVAHEAEWIRIRNLGAKAGTKQCVRAWELLEHFALEFWVRKADLEWVTRRPVVANFGDGTSAMLSAGAPLMPAKLPLWRALGPGADAELPMQEDAVGKFYRPSALYQPKRAIDSVPRTTTVQLGGHAIATESLLGKDAIDVFARERKRGGVMSTVGSRCAELRVLVGGEAVGVIAGTEDAAIAERTAELEALDAAASGDRYAFEAGALVFWDDGEKAGELVAPHTFDRAPSIDSDRRCFHHAGLALCLRADDMKTIRTDAGW